MPSSVISASPALVVFFVFSLRFLCYFFTEIRMLLRIVLFTSLLGFGQSSMARSIEVFGQHSVDLFQEFVAKAAVTKTMTPHPRAYDSDYDKKMQKNFFILCRWARLSDEHFVEYAPVIIDEAHAKVAHTPHPDLGVMRNNMWIFGCRGDESNPHYLLYRTELMKAITRDPSAGC